MKGASRPGPEIPWNGHRSPRSASPSRRRVVSWRECRALINIMSSSELQLFKSSRLQIPSGSWELDDGPMLGECRLLRIIGSNQGTKSARCIFILVQLRGHLLFNSNPLAWIIGLICHAFTLPLRRGELILVWQYAYWRLLIRQGSSCLSPATAVGNCLVDMSQP
jgi:hypothetical protein